MIDMVSYSSNQSGIYEMCQVYNNPTDLVAHLIVYNDKSSELTFTIDGVTVYHNKYKSGDICMDKLLRMAYRWLMSKSR